jgi:hypothetical protein
MKHLTRLFVLLLSSALAIACAAPSATTGTSGLVPDAAAEPARTPPMSTPYPPRELKPEVDVDYSCRTRADCAVKNVGNCCGAQPACVNKDSPVDAAAVQAQCQASGMMGVCGFQEISACQCVSGRCEPDASADSKTLPAQ